MSYDASLTINTGKGEVEVREIGNYTSNVARMWALALQGKSLASFSGMKAGEAYPALMEGVKYMLAHRGELKTMEPANGWGDFDGALQYLVSIAAACEDNPLCTLVISN